MHEYKPIISLARSKPWFKTCYEYDWVVIAIRTRDHSVEGASYFYIRPASSSYKETSLSKNLPGQVFQFIPLLVATEP